MSICFRSLNYLPSSVNSCLSQSKGKKNHALGKLAASITPPQIEALVTLSENNKIPFPNSPSTNRNFIGPLSDSSIGIIGGLFSDSSLNFSKKLDSNSPFVVCKDPPLRNDELSSFAFPSGKTGPAHNGHQSSIVENLRRKRVFLEKSGVCCIAMPCHVSHLWHDEIKEGCSVPFLHMGECVAKELKEAKLKPIEAGSPLRIGVLAINPTLVAKVYQEKLEQEGFEVIMPDKATVAHIVIPAIEAISRKDFEGARNLFRIALQVLLVKAVNKIVVASDEFRGLLPPDDPLWRRCVDPVDSLARSAVEYARGK
ncbi:hypothetical protein ABFS82_04G104800 [Erythranthe guttata]|uniref:Aspartate racemase n=1 Tax=Erythranthe guttata TaxID=4155 RepID=A0A022QAM2_ERYGU|nr:PREDICTED: uncharacterized protein LOC105972438 [Erythranthe guttata]EYU24659.1 hypothetical protein MIMGU_mgv1a010458mg [Erythranthe guttata]|eukprot:XP_012852851.1 PREDICTED: uncharacterized protein LOC105972438 [Erythranthe guttata]